MPNRFLRFFLVFIIVIAFSESAKSQAKEIILSTEIDTFITSGDSTFVLIRTTRNGNIIEESHAILIPDSIISPKFALLGSLWKSKTHVSRIMRNGKTIEYTNDSTRKVLTYYFGELKNTKYFNKNLNEITENEYLSSNRSNLRGPCGTSSAEYIIEGTKK